MLKLTVENTHDFVGNLVSNHKIRYAMEFLSLTLRERRFSPRKYYLLSKLTISLFSHYQRVIKLLTTAP
jgi:hypothetical protein